jgi:DNA (cytosine-5)-methyltransferase 3A
MNVLSLFDGMSCGQQALERAGFKVDNYFASEIDKYAIQVTMANYPNTKQLGSVVNVDGYSLPKIDILIGGSPCQSFSFAGKRKGMSTKDEQEILTLEHYLELKAEGFEFEGQSYLFWEYMRLLNEVKPKYFLLENVMMGEKWEKVLSKAIGVKPIMINSALVSAQNRQRLYWTNIGLEPAGLFGDLESTIQQPKDKRILLKDVLQPDVDLKYYLSDKMISWLDKHALKRDVDVKKLDGNQKSSCLTATAQAKQNLSTDYIVHNMMPRSSTSGKGGTGHLSRADGKTYCLDTGTTNAIEIVAGDFRNDEGCRWREGGKTGTLMAQARQDGTAGQVLARIDEIEVLDCYNNNIRTDGKVGTITQHMSRSGMTNGFKVIKNSTIRRLTPVECERLQTVKDNYTNHVSDSQRYKMLGNGWTVDVIVHILKYMK